VDLRYLRLATAYYFNRFRAVFVVHTKFELLEVKVPLICLSTQGVSLRRDGHYIAMYGNCSTKKRRGSRVQRAEIGWLARSLSNHVIVV
jgi:hypothetical protein